MVPGESEFRLNKTALATYRTRTVNHQRFLSYTVPSKNGKGKRFQLLFKRTPAVNTADSRETTGEKGMLKNYHEMDHYDFFF